MKFANLDTQPLLPKEPETHLPLYTDTDNPTPTQPCPIPEPFRSGIHAIPENDTAPLVARSEIATLLLRTAAASGAVVVGFESVHLWYLGGATGAWLAVVTNGAAVALGASAVAMWRRR
jgi:hypothetical protein